MADTSLKDWVTEPRTQFSEWRQPRPVFGGSLLLLGGLIIGYVPVQFASELLLVGGVFTVIGLLFATLVVFCGIAVMADPRYSSVFGVLGAAFSTLSLFGALGGLFVGMFVGTAGGILAYAWRPPDGYEYEEVSLAEESEFIWQETGGFIFQDSGGFVWGNNDEGTDDESADGEGGDELSDDPFEEFDDRFEL